MFQIPAPLLQSGIQQSERALESQVDSMIRSADHTSHFIIHFCIIVIVVCLISAVVTIVALFRERVKHQRIARRTERLEEKYDLLLTGIIFDDIDEEFEEKRQKLIKHFRKKYLVPQHLTKGYCASNCSSCIKILQARQEKY
jgi:hypothetical protein